MERYTLESIPLSDLCRDDLYGVRYKSVCLPLDPAVAEKGVLIPLIVTGDKPYRIVSGHRRRQAAEKAGLSTVPALVLKETLPERELFLLSLMANEGQAYLFMDQMFVVRRAVNQFGFPPEEVMRTILPLLGAEPVRKNLDDLVAAGKLHPTLQEAISAEILSSRGWQGLLRFSLSDQETFARDIASNLCLSSSQLSQAGEWLKELSTETKMTLRAFLDSSGLRAVLETGPSTDRRQKTDSFMKKLRALRYPRVTLRQEQFEAEARHLEKHLADVRIEAPPHFEEQGIILKLQIKDPSKLEDILRSLQENKTSINALLKTVL